MKLKQLELKPIDNGWKIFKGTLPQTTDVQVWDLKVFADYGDKQSIEWLDEINQLTEYPNLWVKTSDYIGYKSRK